MREIIISVKNVGLSYSKRRSLFSRDYYAALKDISFDVFHGETLGIIGSNGSGKSTLLKILSGIYMPDTGTIDNYSKKTSLLTLQAGFDNNLSGRDNALLSGMLLGYEKESIFSKLDEICTYSELGEFFNLPMSTYSTGMRARLGFATIASFTPEVLLIDEVLGVGDDKFRIKSTQTMENMIRSDHTVILVSHSAVAISKLCNRVIWIDEGVVAGQGDPEQVLAAYHKK